MARVRVSTSIKATPDVVWRELEDIERHTEWMADAVAIHFTSPQRRGVGTTFDCETRIGPLRMVDRMAITEWRPRRAMGVRHDGLITGSGRFTLRRTGRRRTRFVWREQLRFPWWLGGRLTAVAAAPVFWIVWRGNLRRLARAIEGRPTSMHGEARRP
jgi:hypothetical protein